MPLTTHTLLADRLVKSRCDGIQVVREKVAVSVQRQDRGRMPKHRLHGFDVRPGAHRK